MASKNIDLKALIRNVEHFPTEGILFRDITTVLKDREALKYIIDVFTERYSGKEIDYILGADARGFIFGAALAYNLGCGFVPVRKSGKLPYKTVTASYDLEYGSSEIEMHIDAIEKGSKVIVVDDLLATGGTAAAMVDLVEKLGGDIIELAFLIELEALEGRKKLGDHSVFSIVKY